MLPRHDSDAYLLRFEAAKTTLGHPEWLRDDVSVDDLVIAVGEALHALTEQVEDVSPPRWWTALFWGRRRTP